MDEKREVGMEVTITIHNEEEILTSKASVFHGDEEYALLGAMPHVCRKAEFLAKTIFCLPDYEYLTDLEGIREYEDALVVAAENLINAWHNKDSALLDEAIAAADAESERRNNQ